MAPLIILIVQARICILKSWKNVKNVIKKIEVKVRNDKPTIKELRI
jgi:hypothetical protein